MRPLRAGGRPVFLWEAFGGGCSGGGGAIKTAEVTLVPLPPLADTVLNRGSGEGSESAKSSFQLSEQNSIVMGQKYLRLVLVLTDASLHLHRRVLVLAEPLGHGLLCFCGFERQHLGYS